jgi:hypothetical protein
MSSSVVAKMKYNPETSTLKVTYVSGHIYDYKNVPPHVYEKMKAARSKGAFLNRIIKTNFNFEKIK